MDFFLGLGDLKLLLNLLNQVYDDEITTDRTMINAGNQGPETCDWFVPHI